VTVCRACSALRLCREVVPWVSASTSIAPKFSFIFLAGGPHTSVSYRENTNTNPVTAQRQLTRFAFALGGGVDLRISKRISARVFQMDWFPMPVKDRRVIASDGTVVDIKGGAAG
jgi:hypothetical protein